MSTKRIVPQRPGLSYVDANSGRITTEGPDVLDIKSRIRDLWGGTLEAYFDWHQMEWIVVENCLDGQQRFVLACKPREFTERLVDRLRAAGNTTTVEQMNIVDAHNERLEKLHEDRLMETTGDAAERLMHAFRKDGLYDHCDIYGGQGKNRKRVGNRGVRAHRERRVA